MSVLAPHKGAQSELAGPTQVTLYLLLMEQRYGAAMPRGLLWYLSQPQPEVVRRVPEEVSALLMQRNQLAAALSRGGQLPPLQRDPRICGGCFQLATCALAHKVGKLCCMPACVPTASSTTHSPTVPLQARPSAGVTAGLGGWDGGDGGHGCGV